jgi:hypothetical protein
VVVYEAHFNPTPYPYEKGDPNYYRAQSKVPLGGMRTYKNDGQLQENLAVIFKLARTGDVFMAEGLFWGYRKAMHQTERYRREVRETIYTGLTYRNPLMMTWEERVVEDERILFERIRRAVDWRTPFQSPRVVVRTGQKLTKDLTRYETDFSRIPLEYRIAIHNQPAPEDAALVIQADGDYAPPAFASQGGRIPDVLKRDMPLRLSAGWAANYAWSEDRRLLLAFVRATGEAAKEAEPPPPLELQLQNFPPGKLPFQLFDLAGKTRIASGEFEQDRALKPESPSAFLYLLVGGKSTE